MTEPLFDLSAEYDRMLQQGLDLSGENKEFFLRGRVAELLGRLPEGFSPSRVLDFGCGTGATTELLAERFPGAEVVGTDTADNALRHAAASVRRPNARFERLEALSGDFDLCYANGVFHHIEPARRLDAARLIRERLRPGGRFAFFDNNPLNPGARWVMRRIPFDRDAVMIWPGEARRLLADAGFSRLEPTRSLFYFPRALAFLRPLEPALARLPFGAQYLVLAER